MQQPYHHIHPFRYRHPRLVSLQTWQRSHHHLQVSQTYHFPLPFRASLHHCRRRRRRRRRHHQAFLEARPAASSLRRLLAFLHRPLASGRLQEGSLPHPRGYSAVCPLRLQASSRDAGPRLSHKARHLVLTGTLRHHLYPPPHPLLCQRRRRFLPRHSCVISRRRALRSCLLRSNANAPLLEGA